MSSSHPKIDECGGACIEKMPMVLLNLGKTPMGIGPDVDLVDSRKGLLDAKMNISITMVCASKMLGTAGVDLRKRIGGVADDSHNI
jgi:hypothetical protein